MFNLIMYKTISVSNNTFQNLQTISLSLNKPKAQVVDDLIQGYMKSIQKRESDKLEKFNSFVNSLSEKVNLPQGAKIDSSRIDQDFGLLDVNLV